MAFAVPLLWLRPRDRSFELSVIVLAVLGGAILLARVREFYVSRRGPLAPWSPPRPLVIRGLYRYSPGVPRECGNIPAMAAHVASLAIRIGGRLVGLRRLRFTLLEMPRPHG